MKLANVLITLAIAAMTVSVLAFLNRPAEEPAWPARIQGFAFSPMHAHHDPVNGIYPTEKEISADLALLAGKANAVRTYTVEGVMAKVPELAAPHGLNVNLGAWIDARLEHNENELARFLQVSRDNPRAIVRAVVGNEVVLRGDVPVEVLTGYLERVRRVVDIPVSTAEPWHVWIKHPELARHVDYLAVHMLPYWEGVDVNLAVDYITDKMQLLQQVFPDKPIVIAEVGWPSNGRTREAAVASEAKEAQFLRRFLARAAQEKYIYYIMEAFDQPWKRQTEGAVGAYWGVYDVERIPKFPFAAPIVAEPYWYILAGVSVILATFTLSVFLRNSKTLESRGRSFLAVIIFAAATLTVWVVYDYSQQYMTITSFLVGLLLIAGMIGVVTVLIAEAHEWAEALWVKRHRRKVRIIAVPDDKLPMVSIHVPTYNEPPEMVRETLTALALLDYPRYEVIVVDNNTKDPSVWQPVEQYCALLGPRFRFFHVDPLAGFKAGALNFALAQTAAEAKIIAVIDSDYKVSRNWLRDLVPQFRRKGIAIVQAPQDYRDAEMNAFKAMCYAEYRGFFYIGMITRNERNAIIQHGTMTLIRRRVLEEIGGWGEWCITEDAELGLRIFERGHYATYIPQSYGRGLMPDTFTDFKMQRFRWAYGAVQIMRRHAGELLDWKPSHLTFGQRYHFIAGWLPWLADGFNVLFTVAALAWSLAMIMSPATVDPPVLIFSVLPLALFVFKSAKLVYLYQTRIDATIAQTLAAGLAGLALSHIIGRAVLLGLVTRNKPFFRTPKLAGAQALVQAIGAAREECLFLIALLMAAAGVAAHQAHDSPDLMMWVIVLLVQALPYAASLTMSLIGAFPRLSARFIGETGAGPRATLPSE